MKTCKECAVEKPSTEFYKHKTSKDGLQGICKICWRAASAARYAANPEKAKANMRGWAENNKPRIKELNAMRYARNSDKIKTANKQWAVDNRDKANSIRKEWRRAHPHAVKSWSKRWRDGNPHKRRVDDAKRRAAKLKATPTWADQKKIEEFYFVADFLGMLTGEWHHVDHIVPLQSEVVCGLHWEGNLQVLTAAENLKKSNSHSF